MHAEETKQEAVLETVKTLPTFNTGETIELKGVKFSITNAIQGNTKKPGVLVLEEQKSS